jgi:hypothetical protein
MTKYAASNAKYTSVDNNTMLSNFIILRSTRTLVIVGGFSPINLRNHPQFLPNIPGFFQKNITPVAKDVFISLLTDGK